MTSSRSRTSTNSWLALVVVLVAWAVFDPALAQAGRKRVVVLELEGSNAEKFHTDLIKLIKKSHTVVPVDKWNGTAEDLGATKLNDKDVKKVAKKLKIDAVIYGKVDKRRDEYILQLKIREGKSGEIVGNRVDVKAESPRISGSTMRDLKDELLPMIDDIASNRSGFGGSRNDDEEEEEEEEEDDDKPAKKSKAELKAEQKAAEQAAAEQKAADRKAAADKKAADKKAADKKAADKKVAKNDDDDDEEEDEEEDDPLPKSKKSNKKVARGDDDDDEDEDDEDDEEGIEEEGEVEGLSGADSVAPGERAVDLIAGLSFTARRMKFAFEPELGDKPPPYNGVPVAGALLDATVFPLAFGHKRSGMAKNFGITVMYDKVLRINSQQRDPASDMVVVLPTSQSRYAFGAAFRYPLGKLTVGATLRYGKQDFTISPAMGVTPSLPDVSYTIIDPSATLKYQVAAKVVLNLNLGFMLITGTGPIQNTTAYGAATVTGFEGELGGDYMLTGNIFARAAFRFETIGFSFKGSGMLATGRDSDPEQDVFGARDNYLGGAVSVGVLY